MRPLIGNGLVIAEGEEWKRIRKIIDPVFKFTYIREMTPLFHKVKLHPEMFHR